MPPRRVIALLVALGLAAPGVALPQVAQARRGAYAPPELGEDEVELKSGGLVRGTVVEVEPESHVTVIIGGTGKTRRIEWAEVTEVVRGKYRAPPPVRGPAPGRPRLHVEVDGRAEIGVFLLEPGQGDGSVVESPELEPDPGIRKLCDAPCDTMVDGSHGEEFVVEGPGIARSSPFILIDKPAEVTLHVRPGRRPLLFAGWALLAIGATAIVAGGIALTLADDDVDVRRGGGFTLLAGIPLAAGGGVMAAYGRTRWYFGPAGDAGKPRRRRRRGRRRD